MNIKRLGHFIALAEEGRFAPAALRVHLSAAAFGRSIQSLEQQVGMRLFDRKTSGVALTRAGQLLLPRARQLVFDCQCLEHELGLLKKGDAGELGIGVAPVPAATVLPELLVNLRRGSPKLVTRVRFGNIEQLLDRLGAQEIDFCMGDPRLIEDHDRHETVSIGAQAGGLFCRPGHALAGRRRVDAAALTQYGVATVSASPAVMTPFVRGFGFASTRRFPLMVECDDFQVLARMVAQTDVIGILPIGMLGADGPQLCPLHFDGGAPVLVDVHAIWLKGRSLSPAARRAVVLAQQIGARRSGAEPPPVLGAQRTDGPGTWRSGMPRAPLGRTGTDDDHVARVQARRSLNGQLRPVAVAAAVGWLAWLRPRVPCAA